MIFNFTPTISKNLWFFDIEQLENKINNIEQPKNNNITNNNNTLNNISNVNNGTINIYINKHQLLVNVNQFNISWFSELSSLRWSIEFILE